jgi:purine-binding chemotaxis protein CheW
MTGARAPVDSAPVDRAPVDSAPVNSAPGAALSERAEELRLAFDRSFAAPQDTEVAESVELLAIRAGGMRYAMRLAAVSGLFADRVVTPLPGPLPELLGVAAFRGAPVAVYDLGALLGHPAEANVRWLVLDTGTPAVGLAFEELDGHLRAPAGSITATGDGGIEVVRAADGVRPVIDVPGVRAAIEDRVRQFNNGRGW